MGYPEQTARSLLITGANGYLGRWVLQNLESSNSSAIHCLSRGGEPVRRTGPFRWLRGDLLEPSSYRGVLGECETVLHLAALTGKGSADDHFRINREGTRLLVEECRRAGVRNFLHVSTISAKYPNLRYYHYGQAKKQAEEIVSTSGLRYSIVRPTMIFGKDAPVLAGLARLAAGPILVVPGQGDVRAQPIYAADVARVIGAILAQQRFDGAVVELGGPDVVPVRELLARIRVALRGRRGPMLKLPVGPIAWMLAALEPVALGLMPMTAGQLAAFWNDSTADGDAGWCGPRKSLDEMLRLAAADGE